MFVLLRKHHTDEPRSPSHACDACPSPIEYHRLERRRIEELAALVAKQWNVSIAASVVVVGGALYQEVAIRARMNVVKRIDGRYLRRQLARWAGEISA